LGGGVKDQQRTQQNKKQTEERSEERRKDQAINKAILLESYPKNKNTSEVVELIG
jgi:hypothetical protein